MPRDHEDLPARVANTQRNRVPGSDRHRSQPGERLLEVVKCPELIATIGRAQLKERTAIEVAVRRTEQERDAVIPDAEGAKVTGERPDVSGADVRPGVSAVHENSIDAPTGGG